LPVIVAGASCQRLFIKTNNTKRKRKNENEKEKENRETPPTLWADTRPSFSSCLSMRVFY